MIRGKCHTFLTSALFLLFFLKVRLWRRWWWWGSADGVPAISQNSPWGGPREPRLQKKNTACGAPCEGGEGGSRVELQQQSRVISWLKDKETVTRIKKIIKKQLSAAELKQQKWATFSSYINASISQNTLKMPPNSHWVCCLPSSLCRWELDAKSGAEISIFFWKYTKKRHKNKSDLNWPKVQHLRAIV